MEGLVAVLNQERQALEQLVFRLLGARAVLLAGQYRFLGWAAADVESAAAVVRAVGTRRWEVAAHLHASAGPATLEAIRARAAPPLDSLLAEQGRALDRLAAEVVVSLEVDGDLASAGLAHLREDPAADARPAARSMQREAGADALDRAIAAAGYEAVLAALDSIALPELSTFLS